MSIALPRPEHPRPDFCRPDWLNLNGAWDFCFDPDGSGEAAGRFLPGATGYDQSILVPFPWQSPAAGLRQRALNCETAWYRRTFQVPPALAGRRIFLHFGAVDYRATIWINGQPAGGHEGGYVPFAFDITALLQPGQNTLAVQVIDPLDLREIPHGKQTGRPKDLWYECMFSPSSGIWQTVWLEACPAAHIQAVRITPDLPGRAAGIAVDVTAGAASLAITLASPLGDRLHAELPVPPEGGTVATPIDLPNPAVWDVDSPLLYDVSLALAGLDGETDLVTTYFGLRSIDTHDGHIRLNGRPIYLRSALDQGYWPEGLLTAPTDDALRRDIELAKACGLNSLRKHIKFEDPRYYYWADRLGLLIWQDAPSATRFSDQACQRLQTELEAAIGRDYNHPSLFLWCPYNESWGLEYALEQDTVMQDWVRRLCARVRQLDPSRLVVDNSGWTHVQTDLADFHYYTGRPVAWRAVLDTFAFHPEDSAVFLGDPQIPERGLHLPLYARGVHHQGQPLIMSEYGAGWHSDRSWGMRWQTNELRRYGEITGYVYTEIYDIEHEYAGLLTYDRGLKETGYDLAELHADDFLALDVPALRFTVQPGETVNVDTHLSAYSQPPLERGRVEWEVRMGAASSPAACGEFDFAAAPYRVTPLGAISFTVPPGGPGLSLRARAVDEHGRVRARNSLDFLIQQEPPPLRETATANGRPVDVLRINLAAPTRSQNFAPLASLAGRGAVAGGPGAGFLEYSLPFGPQDGDLAALELVFEAAPAPADRGQSVVGRVRPTSLSIYLNDEDIQAANLPDLHQHAGGAVGILSRIGAGEHGDRLCARVEGPSLALICRQAMADGALRVRFAVEPGGRCHGGLLLFGHGAGRYGEDPQVRLVRP